MHVLKIWVHFSLSVLQQNVHKQNKKKEKKKKKKEEIQK